LTDAIFKIKISVAQMMVIYAVILWIGLLSLLDVSQLGFLLFFWATKKCQFTRVSMI